MDIFGSIFGFFGSIFGYVLWAAYYVTQNFGFAIILFTVIVKLIMFPTSVNQQKSMAGNARLQAKQRELQEKYGNDRNKYNEELSKLYEKEGASPTAGCLTSLLPMLLMLGIFYSVAYPLTNTLHLNAESVDSAISYVNTIPGLSVSTNTIYKQIEFVKIFPSINTTDFITTTFTGAELDKIQNFSQGFNFLGLDLLSSPNSFGFSSLLLIPILCFLTSLGSQIVTMRLSGNPAAQQQGCMKYMLYGMPLISAYFAYTVPAAVGFYWITSTVIGFFQSLIMNKFYSPAILNAKQEAQHIALLESEEANIKYEYNPVETPETNTKNTKKKKK